MWTACGGGGHPEDSINPYASATLMKEQDEKARVLNRETTMRELGWPSGVPIERLAASLYDKAMRAGMFESELILGYTFDCAEFPRWAEREDRLIVALNALCRFASDYDRLEELRYDGLLVPDEMLDSDCWTAESPRLPSMHGLYEYASSEWDRKRAEAAAE